MRGRPMKDRSVLLFPLGMSCPRSVPTLTPPALSPAGSPRRLCASGCAKQPWQGERATYFAATDSLKGFACVGIVIPTGEREKKNKKHNPSAAQPGKEL